MPVLTQLNLNIGTEQNPNMVLHDLHDIRISSTDVTTVTRLLGCDAGVNSIAPLTLANAASLLGAVTFINMGTNSPSLLDVPANRFFHGQNWTNLPSGLDPTGQYGGIKFSFTTNKNYSVILLFAPNYDNAWFIRIFNGNMVSTKSFTLT